MRDEYRHTGKTDSGEFAPDRRVRRIMGSEMSDTLRNHLRCESFWNVYVGGDRCEASWGDVWGES